MSCFVKAVDVEMDKGAGVLVVDPITGGQSLVINVMSYACV